MIHQSPVWKVNVHFTGCLSFVWRVNRKLSDWPQNGTAAYSEISFIRWRERGISWVICCWFQSSSMPCLLQLCYSVCGFCSYFKEEYVCIKFCFKLGKIAAEAFLMWNCTVGEETLRKIGGIRLLFQVQKWRMLIFGVFIYQQTLFRTDCQPSFLCSFVVQVTGGVAHWRWISPPQHCSCNSALCGNFCSKRAWLLMHTVSTSQI